MLVKLRIGELARRAAVSVATIKYYIREGLLPPPPVKTGRTMGYYDQEYLDRLVLIRRLREEQYLPIRVIREVLEAHGDKPLSAAESEILGRIGPRVSKKLQPPPSGPLTRAEILERYRLKPDELELLEQLGLVGPGDLELLDALQRMEDAGLTRDRFPVEGIGHYIELLGELARREVRIFLRHASAKVPAGEVVDLAERAVELSEPVLAIIRRRLIAREIQHQTKENP